MRFDEYRRGVKQLSDDLMADFKVRDRGEGLLHGLSLACYRSYECFEQHNHTVRSPYPSPYYPSPPFFFFSWFAGGPQPGRDRYAGLRSGLRRQEKR